MSLSAEAAAEALARDEALLLQVQPDAGLLSRWYLVQDVSVVLGLGLWHRRFEIVDAERCREQGINILERRAGGGALLLDRHMLCAAVCIPLPDARVGTDLTESYRWLGDRLSLALHPLGLSHARRAEVDEARADVAALKTRKDPLVNTCFGALSPHEVVLGSRKLVGLAQVRRRHAALFQVGVLLRDQSPLADLLRLREGAREHVRAALAERTVGLHDLSSQPLAPEIIAGALEAALRA